MLGFAYTPSGQSLSESGKAGNNKTVFARDFVWLGGKPLAQIKRKVGADDLTRRAKIVYLHTDHLNTPRATSNDNGVVVWRWRSDAFGAGKAERDADGDGKNTAIRLRFPGQYYDSESGLHYNHHRDYDPKLGRYIQPDPIGLRGGINRYAYAGGNPLSYTDFLGLYAIPVDCPPGTAPNTGCGVKVSCPAPWTCVDPNSIAGQLLKEHYGGDVGPGTPDPTGPSDPGTKDPDDVPSCQVSKSSGEALKGVVWNFTSGQSITVTLSTIGLFGQISVSRLTVRSGADDYWHTHVQNQAYLTASSQTHSYNAAYADPVTGLTDWQVEAYPANVHNPEAIVMVKEICQ